jgi:phospholipid/cholesterol/gamma-HCH transport system substrate-binding protein
MNFSKAVGAGVFVVLGAVLFTAALFMIGERRLLFENRFPIYTEYAKLGELETGAVVRVAGMDAGEVTEIQIPATPSGKFRIKMELREDLHQLIRQDSVATTQTEGLVGGIFVNVTKGSERAARVPENGVIPSREPFSIADLLQQASETVNKVTMTVEALRGDAETAVQQIAATASDAHDMLTEIRPDLTEMTRNASRISGDAQSIVASINDGKGTIGKLVNDDGLYLQVRQIADQAKAVMDNVKQVTDETRRAVADFRSSDGPAQGLMSDMRVTLDQAREATGDLADNMEAMKHNFLLRGFFNKRGYFDLDAISPADYRKGVLEGGKRKAMRIWLSDAVLFAAGPEGTEVLSEGGRIRLESAMATYLKYLPSSPLVVEGYATDGSTSERFRRGRARAGMVREFVMGRYQIPPQNIGYISLGNDAQGSPDDSHFNGVALTLFLDREALAFEEQSVAKTAPGATGAAAVPQPARP